jgi:serine/threonine protein kinase
MSGSTQTVHSDLEVVRAALVDDYEVLEEIGRGGMAIVFRARDRQLHREIAIKVLPFAIAHDAEVVERFQREARLAAALEHPNIVPIYRVGRSGDVIYFAMKLVRGQSLSARIAARGRLSAAEVRRVLLETAAALGAAHRRDIVHRDVKPDNIMLDEDGRCVVMDFGIARSAADSKLTASGMSLGTPRYMSPEQARARELDGRSDLYSLGVVGYHCLVGRPPFDGDDAIGILMNHVQAPVPRPEIASGGSAEERQVYAVIERLLAKDAQDRYDTAEQLIAALGSATTGASARPSDANRTRPVPQTDLIGRAPQSSAALDSALDAGLDLLKQQRPRVEAGLAAGRRLVDANAPRVRHAAQQGARAAGGALSTLHVALAPRLMKVTTWARARGGKFWLRAAAGVAMVWGAYSALQYALLQRSRCPVVAVGPAVGDFVPGGVPSKRSYSVLVDHPGNMRQGSDFDVYYDVCGLESGSVRTQITVMKSESGLRRLLGNSAEPISLGFDETVSSPRMRRHHSVNFDGMPAGAYRLYVVVSDGKGRRRESDVDFHVRPR